MPRRTTAKMAVTCGVCGHAHTVTLRPREGRYDGTPGLDLRPGGVGWRGTVTAIAECPDCHFASPDIAAASDEIRTYVRGDDFPRATSCPGPALATQWHRWAQTLGAVAEAAASGHASMRAAWACDDAEDDEAAVHYRRAAIVAFARAIEQRRGFAQDAHTQTAVLIDLHRRAGDMTRARELATGLRASSRGTIARVADFEITLVDRADPGGYTVGDADAFARQPDTWFDARSQQSERRWWRFWG